MSNFANFHASNTNLMIYWLEWILQQKTLMWLIFETKNLQCTLEYEVSKDYWKIEVRNENQKKKKKHSINNLLIIRMREVYVM